MNPLLVSIATMGALLGATLGAAVSMIVVREGYRALMPSLLQIAIAGVLAVLAGRLTAPDRALRLTALSIAAGLLIWVCAGLLHRGYRLFRAGGGSPR